MLYRISGPYWDGVQLHPAGAVLEFEEGKAPPRSQPVEPPKGKK